MLDQPAPLLKVAAAMTRDGSPAVVVMADDFVVGVVTVNALLTVTLAG